MKGIILAGGSGTRLYPLTKAVSKQLLPVYDKPMIYYPMSVLMLAEIREVLIITNPEYIKLYEKLFGNGKQLGMKIEYAVQEKPTGIADAFVLGENFIKKDNVCLILGDNIFFGQGFRPILKKASLLKEGAYIFGYYVSNPSDFGIVEFDKNKKIISIEEKPKHPKSNYAITGLYFYDNEVINIAKNIEPSKRGEKEITSVNQEYLKRGNLKIELLGRGFAWLDTGTYEGLANANNFVETIQKRTGLYIACLEEIAYNNNWIDEEQLIKLGKEMKSTEYGKYLLSLAERR